MVTKYYMLFRDRVIGDYHHELFDFDFLIKIACFAFDTIILLLFLILIINCMMFLQRAKRWWIR